MSRVYIHHTPPFRQFTSAFKPWVPSLAAWGFGAGSAALLFLSVTPLVKRELLVKIPVLKGFFEDTTPASDKPF